MKNLDQMRAANSLNVSIRGGQDGGNSIAKKVSAMIRENGFLASMAFAKEKDVGYKDVFNAIIDHLRKAGQLHGLPDNFDGFLAGLCQTDSATLRAVTAEAMAYINYLRRFPR